MTDYELHRKEWLRERAGMLMSDGMPKQLADHRALEMWLENNCGDALAAIEASKTSQEPRNDLD